LSFFSSNRRLCTGFIFQQNSAPAHTARSARNWLRASCPDIITKGQWPLNSPNINPMDYHVWDAILEAYRKLKTKPKTSAELKEAFQVIWDNLPQGQIDKAVKDLSNKATGGWCCNFWNWRWTLRTFAVTMQFWHLITIQLRCFNDVIKLVL